MSLPFRRVLSLILLVPFLFALQPQGRARATHTTLPPAGEPVDANAASTTTPPASTTTTPAVTSLVDPVIDSSLGRISGSSPFAACDADNVDSQTGAVFLNSEVEPFVAVDPADGNRLVATWQQDRWSNGGGRGIGTAASSDGGLTWSTTVLPGLTPCSGGDFDRASDPWVSIGADGVVHHVALAVSAPTEGLPRRSAIVTHRSLDGGLTWSEPVLAVDETSSLVFNDKPTITANPFNADRVHVVWTRAGRFPGARRPIMIANSSDGGLTWPEVIEAFDPGLGRGALGAQIVVEPTGDLRLFASVIAEDTILATVEGSPDGGTWAAESEEIAEIQASGTRDPDDGSTPFRVGEALVDVAVDLTSGALFATWQDSRFGAERIDSVVFSMSIDGKGWSEPIRIDDVPELSDRPLDSQAFLPSVAVGPDGSVGIGWYDMRTNVAAEPGVPTEYRFRACRNRGNEGGCAVLDNWDAPVVLTDSPFDVTKTPIARGRFLGDYVGLTGSADGFVAVFTVTHDEDPASQVARRVVLEPLPMQAATVVPPAIPAIPVRPSSEG